MMNQHFDVAVVGAGVIGTTVAWRLAQTGRAVVLIERDHCGAEASSAAAGILGAQLEVSEPGPFYDLCVESRGLFQSFVDELFELTGKDSELKSNGLLQIAYTEVEAKLLQEKMRWQRSAGSEAYWMDEKDVAKREVCLAPCFGALYLPDDGNILATGLMSALETAVKKTCTLLEGVEVFGVQMCSDQTYSLMTSCGTLHVESVVVAAGAWANHILGPLAAECNIQPVKGQLVAVRPQHGAAPQHTVYHDHVYLVPKRNGMMIVGATEDREAGFNRNVASGPIASLITAAQRIVPGIGQAIYERSWIGIRPGSSDNRPWVGPVTASKGMHAAVGHYRNGILLAPVTGKMIVHGVEGREYPEHWQAFGASREGRCVG